MIDNYCAMIHGGLELKLRPFNESAMVQHCCLLDNRFPIKVTDNYWNNQNFIPLRELNKQGKLIQHCYNNCIALESSGQESFRTGMNRGLGINNKINLTGPARIDIGFDISCNLACRTCGTYSSTFWQKHLKNHGSWNEPITPGNSQNDVINALSQLDLSNLRMVVFCGGETLLGTEYWGVTKWLAETVPNAKENLTLCFQTNGTQPISSKYFELIDRFHLVKLNCSIDGVGKQFEYLRWPANWEQVNDNLQTMHDTLPGNVMFLVETTLSIFNIFYAEQIDDWAKTNFSANRFGDITNHTKHSALGVFSLNNLSSEYVDYLSTTKYAKMIPKNWQENTENIQNMIEKIKLEDQRRNQSWNETFPEVANFYKRFNQL